MSQNGSKVAQKSLLIHLFQHPKGCRNNVGKNHFVPLLDPQTTPVTLPWGIRHLVMGGGGSHPI